MKPRHAAILGVALLVIGASVAGIAILWRVVMRPAIADTWLRESPAPPDLPGPPTVAEAPVALDFSETNAVSVSGAMENGLAGLVHVAKERDGRTSIESVDGVVCRYLNRKAENKWNGFIYFAIDPSFKLRELKDAEIEVEVFVNEPVRLRLQYDAMDGDLPKPYKSVVARGFPRVSFGGNVVFTQLRASNEWQTVRFRATNGVFLNSQNGRSDFRLEVTPPEIYVRRVTVMRAEE